MSEPADLSAVLSYSLADFEAAATRIAGDIVRTPVLPYFGKGAPGQILLKAENLQPLGSFKIRCAANAAIVAQERSGGRMATASAGNFAQGLALVAQRRGIELTVHTPNNAARVKIAALSGLGARVIEHPFDDWWSIMSTRDTGQDDGLFLHPVAENEVIAGNATIGLELAEQLPPESVVVIPYGGGGLSCGIALGLRASGKKMRIVAVEVETATPLTAARAAGQPTTVVRGQSFIDGIGSTRILDPMWPLAQALIDDVVVVSMDETRDALRSAMLDNHLVLEGAAAAAIAAARRTEGDTVCAILSGGNIDPAIFAEITASRATGG